MCRLRGRSRLGSMAKLRLRRQPESQILAFGMAFLLPHLIGNHSHFGFSNFKRLFTCIFHVHFLMSDFCLTVVSLPAQNGLVSNPDWCIPATVPGNPKNVRSKHWL